MVANNEPGRFISEQNRSEPERERERERTKGAKEIIKPHLFSGTWLRHLVLKQVRILRRKTRGQIKTLSKTPGEFADLNTRVDSGNRPVQSTAEVRPRWSGPMSGEGCYTIEA